MDDELHQNGSENDSFSPENTDALPKFAYDLSESGKTCPPENAKDAPDLEVVRWVANDPPKPEDFLPRLVELAQVPPNSCPCQARGISFYSSEARHVKFNDLACLPTFDGKNYVAKIKINSTSGKVKCNDPNSNGHICLWRYVNFEPQKHILSVEAVT